MVTGLLPRQKELVHTMLKPDALEFGLRDVIIRELQQEECEIVASKRHLKMKRISLRTLRSVREQNTMICLKLRKIVLVHLKVKIMF